MNEETEILQDNIDFIDDWFFDMELQNLLYQFDMAMEQEKSKIFVKAGTEQLPFKVERKLKQEVSM